MNGVVSLVTAGGGDLLHIIGAGIQSDCGGIRLIAADSGSHPGVVAVGVLRQCFAVRISIYAEHRARQGNPGFGRHAA